MRGGPSSGGRFGTPVLAAATRRARGSASGPPSPWISRRAQGRASDPRPLGSHDGLRGALRTPVPLDLTTGSGARFGPPSLLPRRPKTGAVARSLPHFGRGRHPEMGEGRVSAGRSSNREAREGPKGPRQSPSPFLACRPTPKRGRDRGPWPVPGPWPSRDGGPKRGGRGHGRGTGSQSAALRFTFMGSRSPSAVEASP